MAPSSERRKSSPRGEKHTETLSNFTNHISGRSLGGYDDEDLSDSDQGKLGECSVMKNLQAKDFKLCASALAGNASGGL